MAKLITKKYQNKNEKSSACGKWYARIAYTETLSTEEFVKHIRNHGSPFDRATIMGVLMTACDCLVELVLDSKKVRLGDLGTFYLSAKSTGSETEDKLTAENVNKLYLRFCPNLKRSYALDSVSMRGMASLRDIAQIDDRLQTADNEGDGEQTEP